MRALQARSLANALDVNMATLMGKSEKFEIEVRDRLRERLDDGDFGIDARLAKVFHRRAYPSRDRGTDIIVDVSIELSRKGAAAPFLVWVWECKAYRHAVPVDDVEEFHAKLAQIGADRTKGTVVTTGKFQKGASAYAQSKGIGLVRIAQSGRWQYVAECWAGEPEQDEIAAGLIAAERAVLSVDTYTQDSKGWFGYDLGDYIAREIRLISNGLPSSER